MSTHSRRSNRTSVEPSVEPVAQENHMYHTEDLTVESVESVNYAEPETTTPKREVSEAAKAALKEYQEASKKAKAFLSEVLLGKYPDIVLPNEVVEAIRVLVPIRSAKSGGTPRGSKQQLLDKLLVMFQEHENKLTLMEIFREFKMGEGEMRIRMRNSLNDRKPEERMWISYDPDSEVYTLEAVGVNPPAGWTGTLPKNK